MSHASMNPELREEAGINDRIIRLSVGIEDVDDLIEDLDQALSFEKKVVVARSLREQTGASKVPC